MPSPASSSAPRPAHHTNGLSLLVILGAAALLCLGAVAFRDAMKREALHTSLEVVRTEQLNTAAFLARELAADPTADPAVPVVSPVPMYRDALANFNSRHGINAYVVDTTSFEPVTETTGAVDPANSLRPDLESTVSTGTVSNALKGRQRTQGIVDAPSGLELITLVPIAGSTHTVVMHRPVEPILDAAGRLATHFTGYLFAAFVAILIVVAFFVGTLTRPLRALTYAAQRIGQGDLDLLVQVHSTAEVGSLAEAFNTMSRELRSKYRELGETSRRLGESNKRYREVLAEYERQNDELQLLNSLVFEANRADPEREQGQSWQAQRIRESFGLDVVGLFRVSASEGWVLDYATDPLLATCEVEEGGLLAALDQLQRVPKVRLCSPALLGNSRGSSFTQRLTTGECCIVPIVVQGVLEAAFVLIAADRPHFHRRLVERFVRLANQLGVILHKDTLLAETTRRRNQLERINRLGNALLTDLDFDTMVPRLLLELNRYVGADQAMLLLMEDETLKPVMAIQAEGREPAQLRHCENEWNETIRTTGETVRIAEYPRHDLWNPAPDALEGDVGDFHSYLGVPLREGNAIIGVLGFFSLRPGRFDEDDEQFLETFATQLSQAIVTARLFQEICARDERRNVQLATAKQFQADRIPALYDDGGLEARATILPADDLAGDFFDVFRLSPNITGLVIGDVASKGVAASLLTFSMLAMFRNLAHPMRPPAVVVEKANELTRAQLRADFWFVTAFYARINHVDMTMTYCKAGHVLPVLYRAASRTIEFLDGDGLPLGIEDHPEYSSAQVDLSPGDRLVLYTDGVTERRNAESELFGQERLAELVVREGHRTADELRQIILDEVEAFSGEGMSRDDTLVAVVGFQSDPWIRQDIRYDEMEALIEKVMQEVRSFPITSSCLYTIRLALNETIANAYNHGNHEDDALPIVVSYRITDNYFALVVRDHGPGFDYENLPDPTVPENLILTHGRGVFLMRQLIDEIEFNERGNEIRLRKYFTFDQGKTAAEALEQASKNVKRDEETRRFWALSGAVE